MSKEIRVYVLDIDTVETYEMYMSDEKFMELNINVGCTVMWIT